MFVRFCRKKQGVIFRGMSAISNNNSVAIAMSGGVDSAAAAMILKDQGWNCVGVFMRNWDNADESAKDKCPIDKDRDHMLEVCNRLGIPGFEVQFIKEYWTEVFTPFLESYQSGVETPNPDVYCNRHIKFHHFKNFVREKWGISKIATGHYVRLDAGCKTIKASDSALPQHLLYTGLDSSKDQSYFLSMTSGEMLRDVIFPIGGLTKTEVRRLVSDRLAGLGVLTKPESMGVCFIGKRPLQHFISSYIDSTPGRFIDIDTRQVVGTHLAKETLTIGQGARVGGAREKYFIVSRARDFLDFQWLQKGARQIQDCTLVHSGKRLNDLRVMSDLREDLSVNLVKGAKANSHKPADASANREAAALGTISMTSYNFCEGDVFVAAGSNHPALYCDSLTVRGEDFSWVADDLPPELRQQLKWAHAQLIADTTPSRSGSSSRSSSRHAVRASSEHFDSSGSGDGDSGLLHRRLYGLECGFKARYRQQIEGCRIEVRLADRSLNTQLVAQTTIYQSEVQLLYDMIIHFDYPQRAVTPGQILALYLAEDPGQYRHDPTEASSADDAETPQSRGSIANQESENRKQRKWGMCLGGGPIATAGLSRWQLEQSVLCDDCCSQDSN